MSVEKICENVKGHFTIVDTESSILGYLYYDLDYSKGNLDAHRARLELSGADSDERRRERASHYFDNGTYTHSEFWGENFFNKIKMPSGIALCRNPSYKKEKTVIEHAGRFTLKAEKIEEQYEIKKKRFQPLRVIISDFQLSENIKKSLQETDEQLVKSVIGDYL